MEGWSSNFRLVDYTSLAGPDNSIPDVMGTELRDMLSGPTGLMLNFLRDFE